MLYGWHTVMWLLRHANNTLLGTSRSFLIEIIIVYTQFIANSIIRRNIKVRCSWLPVAIRITYLILINWINQSNKKTNWHQSRAKWHRVVFVAEGILPTVNVLIVLVGLVSRSQQESYHTDASQRKPKEPSHKPLGSCFHSVDWVCTRLRLPFYRKPDLL